MLTSMFLLPLAVTVLASPIHRRQDDDSNDNVTDAQWDGQCFYPEADNDFELEDYTGRWYQIAGTEVGFTAGCSCIVADYSLNTNGTVNVQNSCQANGESVTIEGTATASSRFYGDEGVFTVQFPGQPAPECPGPNYIVQDQDDDFAIVQASNFSTLFLLSRRAVVDDATTDRWLARAGRLGSDLSNVVKTNQTGCSYPTSK